MPWEGWITIAVLALLLLALVRNWAGTDLVLLAGMTLFMTLSAVSGRFPGPRQMAGEFGNEGLLTIAALFVVACGLTETGGMRLLTARLLGRPATVAGAQLRMMLPVAGVSAFLNNTPVVAMFVPVIHDWCKKTGISPAKLFIPLSYAAVLGGTCTLIGTSTNLVVQGMLIDARKTDPAAPILGFWTIGAIGLPATIAGLAFIVLASRRLLVDRQPPRVQHADPRQYTVEMLVQPDGAIAGQSVESAGLRGLPGCYLMEVQRETETIVAVGPEQVLLGNDRLIFVGVVESVVDLQKIRGLLPATEQVFKLSDPRHQRVLIEAVVSSACPLIGKSIRQGRFRSRYDAAVIAVHRNGQRIEQKIGDIILQAGDTLLLEAHPRFYDQNRDSRDFYLVSAVQDSRPPRHEKAWMALAILLAMVVAMSFESVFSVFNAALLAAGLMLLSGCCNPQAARRSIDWSTLLAIGAAFGIGKTLESTGAAGFIAEGITRSLGAFGPWGALLAVYAVTLLFTELITNNAAAVIAFPIGKAAAAGLGVSFMPFAICIAIAASSGFATPLGYQTHLMVYGPGGYRFSDFLRIGLPLDLLIMAIAVSLSPVMFPFHP